MHANEQTDTYIAIRNPNSIHIKHTGACFLKVEEGDIT